MAAADETTTGLHIEEATGPEDPAEEQLRTGSSAMEIEGGGLVLNPHKKQKKTASTNLQQFYRLSRWQVPVDVLVLGERKLYLLQSVVSGPGDAVIQMY